MAMIVPLLLSTLVIPVKDQASAFNVQAETIGAVYYDPRGVSTVLHIYSDGTSIKSLSDISQVPSDARWVTFMVIYMEGAEIYYSRDGVTTEKKKISSWNEIPADVKWLTLSNFDGSFSENQLISNQQYTYSVDGVNVLSGPEVPANALWATLSYYTTTWAGEGRALNYSRSRETYTLNVDPIRSASIRSNGADPTYAKAGDEVTLRITSLPSRRLTGLSIAGQAVTASSNADLTESWATVTLGPSTPEGIIDFLVEYEDGSQGRTLTATTDGSSVLFDNTPPSVTLTPSTSDWTQDNVIINVQSQDLGSGIQVEKWAEGRLDAAYFRSGGNLASGKVITADQNGWYTWYAKDRAGNETVQSIEIANIDRIAPSLNLSSSPTDWTSVVTISADAVDHESGIYFTHWAPGVQPVSFFKNRRGNFFRGSFNVTSNGDYTVYAEDYAGNAATRQIAIHNLDDIPPAISWTPSTIEPTAKDVVITVDVSDQESGVDIVKWAAGQQQASYFATGGTEVQGANFAVSENGLYTIYARDKAGNEQLETVEITNIYNNGSSLQVSLDNPGWTNMPVRIQLDITGNGSGIAVQKWAYGQRDSQYFENEGTLLADTSFTVDSNGMYSVYIKDNAGYEDVAVIEVTRIDREEPVILEPNLTPDTWTNQSIEVKADATDNSGMVSRMKWAPGVQDDVYFQQGGGKPFQDVFLVDINGDYTIYAEDAAGNGSVRGLKVNNIDVQLPIVHLQISTDLPTNENVTVMADVYGTLSPIAAMKWAPGQRSISYFGTQGTEFDGGFEAELNGWYTIYAESAAGNKQIEMIEIHNIFKDKPVIQLAASPTVPTKDNVTVTASVYAPNPIVDRKLAYGQLDKAYFSHGGDLWSDQLEVHDNGWITYYVRDHAGNEALKQLEITNIDREKPVITLLGDASITIVQHTDFVDPGAVASDNMDGDVTDRIQVTGQVDSSKPGQYILQYSVTDRAGNEAEEVIRTVTVTPLPDKGDSEWPNPWPGSGGTWSGPPAADKGEGDGGTKVPIPGKGTEETPPEPTVPDAGKEPMALHDISGHWAEVAIRALYDRELVKGYPDGTYKPDIPVTRAEFVTLLVRSLQLDGEGKAPFTDSADHWASSAINAAVEHGIVEGYSSRAFGPNDPITREQMAVMLSRSGQQAGILSRDSDPGELSFKDQSSISAWAREHVSALIDSRMMNGYPNDRFLPQGYATRAEVAAVIYRFILTQEHRK
ncbi:hypothetical protein CHH75_13515 [Paenibacillus sp. 7541]|nr:hypothetical protein CHH75_13515 [Paenibacillus sp. 7541]